MCGVLLKPNWHEEEKYPTPICFSHPDLLKDREINWETTCEVQCRGIAQRPNYKTIDHRTP